MRRSIDWIDIAKVVIVLVVVPFIALNVWAYLPYQLHSFRQFVAIPFDEIGASMVSHRFISVIATDLMLGWALTSIVVAIVERSLGHSWFRVLLWLIPLNFVGNVVWALYLILYLRRMCDRLSAA